MLENHGKLGKKHGTIVVFPQSFHISSHVFPMISPPCDHHAMRMAQGTQGTVDLATLALDYWDDSQESEELLVPSFSKNWLGCMVYNYMVYIYITIVIYTV